MRARIAENKIGKRSCEGFAARLQKGITTRSVTRHVVGSADCGVIVERVKAGKQDLLNTK